MIDDKKLIEKTLKYILIKVIENTDLEIDEIAAIGNELYKIKTNKRA